MCVIYHTNMSFSIISVLPPEQHKQPLENTDRKFFRIAKYSTYIRHNLWFALYNLAQQRSLDYIVLTCLIIESESSLNVWGVMTVQLSIKGKCTSISQFIYKQVKNDMWLYTATIHNWHTKNINHLNK